MWKICRPPKQLFKWLSEEEILDTPILLMENWFLLHKDLITSNLSYIIQQLLKVMEEQDKIMKDTESVSTQDTSDSDPDFEVKRKSDEGNQEESLSPPLFEIIKAKFYFKQLIKSKYLSPSLLKQKKEWEIYKFFQSKINKKIRKKRKKTKQIKIKKKQINLSYMASSVFKFSTAVLDNMRNPNDTRPAFVTTWGKIDLMKTKSSLLPYLLSCKFPFHNLLAIEGLVDKVYLPFIDNSYQLRFQIENLMGPEIRLLLKDIQQVRHFEPYGGQRMSALERKVLKQNISFQLRSKGLMAILDQNITEPSIFWVLQHQFILSDQYFEIPSKLTKLPQDAMLQNGFLEFFILDTKMSDIENITLGYFGLNQEYQIKVGEEIKELQEGDIKGQILEVFLWSKAMSQIKAMNKIKYSLQNGDITIPTDVSAEQMEVYISDLKRKVSMQKIVQFEIAKAQYLKYSRLGEGVLFQAVYSPKVWYRKQFPDDERTTSWLPKWNQDQLFMNFDKCQSEEIMFLENFSTNIQGFQEANTKKVTNLQNLVRDFKSTEAVSVDLLRNILPMIDKMTLTTLQDVDTLNKFHVKFTANKLKEKSLETELGTAVSDARLKVEIARVFKKKNTIKNPAYIKNIEDGLNFLTGKDILEFICQGMMMDPQIRTQAQLELKDSIQKVRNLINSLLLSYQDSEMYNFVLDKYPSALGCMLRKPDELKLDLIKKKLSLTKGAKSDKGIQYFDQMEEEFQHGY